jgi:hypothetical protein
MKHKSLELDLQMALEGMEELTHFIGYHSTATGLRILSVETVEEAALRERAEKSANVISLESRRPYSAPEPISRSLRFKDHYFQS